MSRVAKAPVDVVSGVEVSIAGQDVTVKGKNGTLVRIRLIRLSGIETSKNCPCFSKTFPAAS